MILLRHAKRIAHYFGRGMASPGLYSGFFYSVSSMTTWPGTSIPKSTGNAFDWRAVRRPTVETRVCIKCGEEKPVSTFNNSGKCGACRYQEQLMRKRHGGAYSRA